ncbi:hypothetical protein BDK51DRAFT_23926 [Blyttiomyces helicus]|uniref:NmrA-like domain-containing protein n=1 Tax=Blyttiomyces helicus TaxID=388810 RepID=A0A4P9WJ16_9FUNG|nr:hypothetical protein BDK51DRAFT_23926 [Blyttiomyces helicus]|eukprot:RKO91458.1 hypothetical protein BDK51DRAFT_23926 [Blyttiomyces helicus]
MSSQPFNRLAIIGYTGWAAEPITKAFINAGVPVKLLNRVGSTADPSKFPTDAKNVTTAQFDYDDEASIVKAFEDIDIVISLVSGPGLASQIKLAPALAKSPSVKLFVPSELGGDYDRELARNIEIVEVKFKVQDALKKERVPFVLVPIGGFAEFVFSIPFLGINLATNEIELADGSQSNTLAVSSVAYTAAGFLSLFATTPPAQLAGRHIWLIERRVSGDEIVAALKKTAEPKVTVRPLEEVRGVIAQGGYPGLAALVRTQWAEGGHAAGADVWEVVGYERATVEDWVGGRRLGALPRRG